MQLIKLQDGQEVISSDITEKIIVTYKIKLPGADKQISIYKNITDLTLEEMEIIKDVIKLNS